jgi:ribose transport system substrate-binding protein
MSTTASGDTATEPSAPAATTATTTATTNPAPPAAPDAAAAPPRRIPPSHYVFFMLLVAAGVAILFLAGAFRRTPRLAIVTAGDTPYWDLVIKGARDAADAYDVNLTVIKSKTDPLAQTEAILGLLKQQKYDGIGISPVNPLSQSGVLADVASATTLVTFDSDSPVSKRLCYVGTDSYAAGRLCGQYVRRAAPDGGDVLLFVSNLDREGAQHRRQGVVDELLDRPFAPEHEIDAADAALAGQQYKIVATLLDNADPAAAHDLAVKAIAEHPTVKVMVGLNGYTTPALLRALAEANKTGQIKVVGFDTNPETLAGIEAGNVYATIAQDQYGCGYHTVRILAENARGNHSGLPMFQRRTLPVEVITRDNLPAARGQLTASTQPS